MKVTVIGAGNVGSMTASRIVDANLADCVLLDIVPGLAKGKALDMSDTRPLTGSTVNIIGTEDFKDMEDSNIVVITAGLARKPGMSRDDLLRKNGEIIRGISKHIKEVCKDAIVIVVTNPLDVMSYLVMKETGFPPERVIGMAGVLDSSRFINIISKKVRSLDVTKIFMMGTHGDSMVPINRNNKLGQDVFKESADRASKRGGEIVSFLKTGSAYFAPSQSVFYMVKAILDNEKKTVCASAYLKGEYGENDIYVGVPVVLGFKGIEEIIEINLTDEEKELFKKSIQVIRDSINKL
ncbi:MAG: malate dehydrogenase [Candidatus Omnitrophota bacterium]